MGKSKKGKKKEEDPEVFHVEVITKARVVEADDVEDEKETKQKKGKQKQQDAKWEYFVKWAGYEDEANSWEPQENLEGCQRLLVSFWKHVGTDDDDCPIGYVVKAKKEWIQSEKDFFAKEYRNAQAEIKRQEKEKRKLKKSKKDKRKSSQEAPIAPEEKSRSKSRESLPVMMTEPEADSDSDDDKPLIQSSSSLRIKIPLSGKRKRWVSASSEEEPLQETLRPSKITKTETMDLKIKEPIAEASRASSPLFSDRSSPELALATQVPSKAAATVMPVRKEIVTPNIPAIKMTSRPINPQARIAAMPSPSVPTGSGISTKQRLGQGALAPTLPKDVGASVAKPRPKLPLPTRTQSSSLMNLNFKKTSQPLPPISIPSGSISRPQSTPGPAFGSPVANDPTLTSLNSPAIHSPQLISGAFTSTSKPKPTSSISTLEQNAFRDRPNVHEGALTLSPATISPPPPQPPPMTEADLFLQSIMDRSLAGPLVPAREEPMEVIPPKPIHTKLPLPGRIPKIWKWSGPLQFTSHINAICNVRIHNLTKDQPVRFSLVFQQIDKIQAGCFYDNADVRMNLGIFRTPPQLALVAPEDQKDKDPFAVLLGYMEMNQKVFMTPTIFDGTVVGYILFFPYMSRFQVIGMDLPADFSQAGNLVAAILPYSLSQEHLKQTLPLPNPDSTALKPTLAPERWSRTLRTKPNYHQGLRILGMSPDRYQYFNERQATYCIWVEKDGNKDSKREVMETTLLKSIMDQTQNRAVSSSADARFIFVHIGSLRTLYKIPAFVERRSKSALVQFYTYGTHPNVSRSLSTVREIYPWGGIVTFTPFAMYSDPLGVRDKIRQINTHPRWTCYILPSALGLLAKLECGNEDPLKVFEKGKLMMDAILQAIEDGEVALLQAPPENATPTESADTRAHWLSKYFSVLPPQKIKALINGITDFLANDRLSKAGDLTRALTMDEEILNDMALMQRQPIFMKNYRRYVVIDSEAGATNRPAHIQGLEWTTVPKFDFKDEFFPKQTVGYK